MSAATRQAQLARALTPGRAALVRPGERAGQVYESTELRALIGRLESVPPAQAARRLGRTPVGVLRKLARLGIRPSDIRADAEGFTVQRVADTLGVARLTAARWIEDSGLDARMVLIHRRHIRIVDPEVLLAWLESRGALLDLNPPELAWREIVAEARQALDARLIGTRPLCDALAITPATLRRRCLEQRHPRPALNLRRYGAWYDRLSVRAWLDQTDRWTSLARDVL